MLTSYWGVVRHGKIEPREPTDLPEGAEVLVTVISNEDSKVRDAHEYESFEADTAQPMTAGMLAQALDKVSTPTKRENTPLPFDPDDHPLF